MNRKKAFILLLLCFTLSLCIWVFTGCDTSSQEASIGIQSVIQTGSEGNADIYTMTFTDGSTFVFTVTNGENGEPGAMGANGASAFELYKQYYPEYAGTEDIWLEDLVKGKLDSDYILNSQCLVTLTIQDTDGYAVSGATVTAAGYQYLTSAEGTCRILTGKEDVAVSVAKSGYCSYSTVISAAQIQNAGKTLAVTYTMEEISTPEGYTVRNENYMSFYIPCEGNNAYYYWYVNYDADGMKIVIDVIDDAVVASESNIGMNDNIEFVMQKNSKSTGYETGNSFNVLVALGKDGHWARRAKSTTEFGNDISDSLLKSGEFYYQKTERNKYSDGYNGYSVTVKLAYTIWDLDYASALGNMTIMPAARNGNTYGKTVFRSYVEKDCIWAQANTAVRIETDGKPVNNYFDLVDFEQALPTLLTYKEGTTLEENMAQVQSTSGDLIREYVSGALLFNDRFYLLHEDGIPSALNGKSYLRGSIMTAREFTVTKAGYVVLAIPATGSFNEIGTTYCYENGFERIAHKMPVVAYSSMGTDFVSEPTDYFIKWCEVGESYSLARWGIVIFGEQETFEQDEWMVVPANTYKLDTAELREKYAPSTRLWQGIPGIEVVHKEDGTVRLWASWFTGNTKEPKPGNYAVYYYSDDDGENWTPAYVVAFDSEQYPNCRVFDPSLFVSEDNELYIWWNQTDSGMSNSSVWYSKISNSSGEFADMVAGTPVKTSTGLKMNKPTKLSTGEWIYAAHDFDDNCKTKVYSSVDKGVTWTLKGIAYVPNGRFANETAIAETKDENGNPVLIMWNRGSHSYGVSVCYSYDLGATWTTPYEFEITGPSSRINARTLESGNIVYVHHYYTETREKLTVFLSEDGGKTWPHALILDISAGVSYPDIAVDGQGNIYITWDYNRYGEKQILFAKISETELLEINGVVQMDRERIGVISSLTMSRMTVAEITGTVSDGTNGIEGATVTAISPYGKTYTTTTDENGVYLFVDLPAELYEIPVTATGYYAASVAPFTEAQYYDSEFSMLTVAPIVLSAEQFTTVTGIIVDEVSDSAVAGATVMISGVSATTGEDGSFTLENVLIANGNNSMTVEAEGFNIYRAEVSLTEGAVLGNVALLPACTTRLGGIGGTNNVVRSEIYLTRTETGVIFTMKSDIYDTTDGTDRVEFFINTSIFGNTRDTQTMLIQVLSSGYVYLNYFPDNANTTLVKGNAPLQYSGQTLTVETSEKSIAMTIPYALFEAVLDLEYADADYSVDESTPIGIDFAAGKKEGGSWKYSVFWNYEDIPGFEAYSGEISRFTPAKYIIVTPEHTLAKSYSDYTSEKTLSSLQELDNHLKTTSVYQENKSLLTDMGSFDISDKDLRLISFVDGAYPYTDHTTHQIKGGVIPALEGMSMNWDGVLTESSFVVDREGYFLLLIRKDKTPDSRWTLIIDSTVPNPGFDVGVTYSLYAVWAKVGEVLNVPADALILTNGIKTKLLVFGDSYTDNHTANFWKNWDTEMAPYGAKSIGISGSKVNGVAARDSLGGWLNRVNMGEIAAYNPEKILIHIGVNDLDSGKSDRQTALEICQLLAILREQLPNTDIYYTLIVQNTNYLSLMTRYDEFNKRVIEFVETEKAAGRGEILNLIDIREELYTTTRAGLTIPNSAMFADGLHLSAAGYRIWCNAIYTAMGIEAEE